ncbi:hypothetical protein ACE10X_44515 [Bradyrhizobium sp. Pha-3]|uniref:hypothetical protein n=1 Tax=Bradyrhizobium sp. Pha-3 TaxID=208375 RepID=UPI0035D433D0
MPIDLHYVCKRGDNFRRVSGDLFETGNWTASHRLAVLAVDGRIFLHHSQKDMAWHGGTIVSFRSAPPPEQNRKIFTYRMDRDYRIFCEAAWSRQIAVARWNRDRTKLLNEEDYLDTLASGLHRML